MTDTLVISDLHLGRPDGEDVLQRPEALERLVKRLAAVERLVILGDVLELRQGPAREALARARPVLVALGQAMAGREVVIAPGNHDHELAASWHAARYDEHGQELGLMHTIAPQAASPLAGAVAEAMAGATVTLAYPGIWLRPDVYATHGHYLDVHSAIPTFERLAAGITGRIAGAVPAHGASPEDYERVLVPNYAWSAAVAARAAPRHARTGTKTGVRVYRMLVGDGPRGLRTRATRASFVLAVAGLRRAGLRPLQTDISGPAMRTALLAAMAATVDRLGIGAGHVIFGHTHRAGPLATDDLSEWRTGTTQLHNTGSWVYEQHFALGPSGPTPFWPGTVQVVGADGPPRREQLLADLAPSSLRPS